MAMPSYSGTQRQVDRARELPDREQVDVQEINDIVIEVNLLILPIILPIIFNRETLLTISPVINIFFMTAE